MEEAFAKIVEEQFILYFRSLPNSDCKLLFHSKALTRLPELQLVARGEFKDNPCATVLVTLDNLDRQKMLQHLGSGFIVENRYSEAAENIWYFFAERFFRQVTDSCNQARIPSGFQLGEICLSPHLIPIEAMHALRSEYLVSFRERRGMTCRIGLFTLFER